LTIVGQEIVSHRPFSIPIPSLESFASGGVEQEKNNKKIKRNNIELWGITIN